MKCHISAIGAALALISSIHVAGADAPHQGTYEIPLVAHSASRTLTTPLWVSSRAAFDKDGRLRADQFTEINRRLINQNIAANSDGECTVFMGAPPTEQYTPKNSLDALVANSLAIVSGEVVGADTGFYLGTPGTLYTVRVADIAKSFGRVGHANPLLLFVPEATIRTAKGSICSRAFNSVPAPTIGDTVLVFSYEDARDVEGRLITVDMHSQLVLQRREQMFAPPAVAAALNGTAIHSVADIVSKIRKSTHLADVPGPGVF